MRPPDRDPLTRADSLPISCRAKSAQSPKIDMASATDRAATRSLFDAALHRGHSTTNAAAVTPPVDFRFATSPTQRSFEPCEPSPQKLAGGVDNLKAVVPPSSSGEAIVYVEPPRRLRRARNLAAEHRAALELTDATMPPGAEPPHARPSRTLDRHARSTVTHARPSRTLDRHALSADSSRESSKPNAIVPPRSSGEAIVRAEHHADDSEHRTSLLRYRLLHQ